MEITIPTTDFTVLPDGTPDRVTTIHWRATETAGKYVASRYGTLDVDLDYATTSEQDCIDAVNAALPDLQSQLDAQTQRIASPDTGTGKPWEQQFPIWQSGVAYSVGDKVNYRGTAYEVIQAHTSQIDWQPPLVPALFEVIQDPSSDKTPWVAGEAVEVDDVRYYPTVGDTAYVCIQAHTTQAGWEPPNTPALWGEQ